MRLFVAAPVPLSDSYRSVTAQLAAQVKGCRPVSDGSWHVTLRFLGEVGTPEAIQSAMAAVAARTPAMDLEVRGLGTFPDARRARILWAGAHADGLAALAEDLARALPLAHDPDRGRAFHGHVTLARVDPPADVRGALRDGAAIQFGGGRLDRVQLLRSDPRPGGPVYTEVASFPLAG